MRTDQNSNSSAEHGVLSRVSFGKESCVKLERNGRGTWLQVGRKSGEAWDWQKAKLSDVEVGELLLVLDARQEQASWFHKFDGRESRISAARKEAIVFVRINDFAAALILGQQVAFGVMCRRILEAGCEAEEWTGVVAGEPEGA